MAYFDHAAAEREAEQLKQYEEIKKLIYTADTLSEFKQAWYHMNKMELTIENQEKELEQYRKFFETLRGFLPRESSIYDIIG